MGTTESSEAPVVSLQYAKEANIAVEAVLKSCEVAQSVAQKLILEDTITKKDNSPVTVADFSVQAVINSYLRKAFPNDPIVAEEKSKDIQNQELKTKILQATNSVLPEPLTEQTLLEIIDEGSSEGGRIPRFWTLDPIDGTKGFLRKEQYAICLALIENGEVILGVLGCPNLPVDMTQPSGPKGCIFLAIKGQGASMRSLEVGDTFRTISTTKVRDPSQLVITESVEAGHSSHGDAYEIAKLLNTSAPSLRMDSQCKYAVLARGDAHAYLRLPVSETYQEKIWDHAAGCLLVKEAGGRVGDTKGAALDFTSGRTLARNKGVVASSKDVSERVLAAVGQVLYPPIQTFQIIIKRTLPTSEDVLKAVSDGLSIHPSLVAVQLLENRPSMSLSNPTSSSH